MFFDGTNQTENITDAALTQFHAHYDDQSITKWQIFHYIYAVLHHPGYGEKFAENLRRELPASPSPRTSTPSPKPAAASPIFT